MNRASGRRKGAEAGARRQETGGATRGLSDLFRALVSASGRGGMVSLADQMVASATNFLTGMIIGRACAREEFGLYMLCMSIVLFVLDLQTSIISSSYMIYSQRLSGRDHARYLGSTLVQQWSLALLLILLLAGSQLFLGLGIGPRQLGPVVSSLVAVIAFIMFREFVRRVCFAGLMMLHALLVDCCVALLQIGGLLLLAWQGLLSTRTAFLVIGLACGTASLGWLVLNRRAWTIRLREVGVDFRKNWLFGRWVFASGLLWALSMNLYPWFLAHYHGVAAAGAWAAAYGVVAIANPLLFGVQNFLGPRIVQAYTTGGHAGLRRFVLRVTSVYFLIVLPLAVLLFFFGGDLVVLVYGAKYAGNGTVVSILAVNLLVTAAAFVLSRAILAVEQSRIYFMANLVPLIILVGFGILLVQKFGPAGVAWGNLASTVATAAVLLFFFSGLEQRTGDGSETA
ncbi:lipopolysaccharide biosynthesis protein [Thermodesulfobacteriota bacterium B35]